MCVDAFVVMLCFGAGFFLVNAVDPTGINFRSFVTYWVYLPAFLVVFYAAGLYPGIMLAPADEVRRFAVSATCCFLGIAASVTIETRDRYDIAAAMVVACVFAPILLPVGREVARRCFSRFSWWGVPAVIYSRGHEGDFLAERLAKHPEFGYRPVLILDRSGAAETEPAAAAAPADLLAIPRTVPSEGIHALIKTLGIKTAILVESAVDDVSNTPLEDAIITLYRYTVLIPHERALSTISLSVRDFGGILGFASTHNLTKPGNLFLKRLIDVVLCAIAAVPVIPLTIFVAAAIRLSSPGPVFYGHLRSGKNGRMFKTWKFRTMVLDAEARLQAILAADPAAKAEWEADRKLTRDPRVTKVGAFLRKTSLDEVPQILNILVGQMSFVGPRPVTESELSKYGKRAAYILSVKPGLSGMWQISGRSDTGYEERVMLDSYYFQNWSIWLDVWILIKTVGVVLRGKGAY
jgi:Undecaprenyl-phosphate galactose phosphotransferase WbaP